MNKINAKRQALARQIRTQKRQQYFSNQRQWQERPSLITLIPFLIDQQNQEDFEEFLDTIIHQDLSVLNQGLSKYIHQKYQKLMTRKYYWNQLNTASQLKKYSHQFDKDTFLVINLLRLKMRLNLSTTSDIDLIIKIVRQDNKICTNQLTLRSAYNCYYLSHYKNMIKLLIELNLFIQSFMLQDKQRQKREYELGVLIANQLQIFPFIHARIISNLQSEDYLTKMKREFYKFEVHYLDILSKQSVNIFAMFFNDKVTTNSKIQFFKKIKEISVVIYHSFYAKEQYQVIRSFKILKKLINQTTAQKTNIQANQTLSVQYKNQISSILYKFIQFFNEVLTQSPINGNIFQDKIQQIQQWAFSEQIIKIGFQNNQGEWEIQKQNTQNHQSKELKCLGLFVLQSFDQIQYRVLLQAVSFLSSAFSYSDKFIKKMFSIQSQSKKNDFSFQTKRRQHNQNDFKEQIITTNVRRLKFQKILYKLMKHISSQVRLNTFWLISNVSGSQINYKLSLPFLKQIFSQMLLYWETNISLREQLFIIVLNFLCNLREIQQLKILSTFQCIEKINKQFHPSSDTYQHVEDKGQSKNMLEWIFQVIAQALLFVKDRKSDQSLIQRVLYALYNLLELSKLNSDDNCFIRAKIESWQINIMVNDLFDKYPKNKSQTLEMLQKISELIQQDQKQ